MITAWKATGAAVGAVTTGILFVVSAGVIHGTALVIVQACLAGLDAIGTTYGVWRIPYAVSVPETPRHAVESAVLPPEIPGQPTKG